jgi:GNAT superfamily N-acetyltransferase
MQPRIRNGLQADIPLIEAFDEFVGDRPSEIEAGTLFVAEVNEVVVGYASYSPYGLLGQPMLTYLCVKNSHRRKGVARSLVKHVQRSVRGRVLISSTEDWCEEMQRLFEGLSWRRAGELSGVNKDGSKEVFYTVAIDA